MEPSSVFPSLLAERRLDVSFDEVGRLDVDYVDLSDAPVIVGDFNNDFNNDFS